MIVSPCKLHISLILATLFLPVVSAAELVDDHCLLEMAQYSNPEDTLALKIAKTILAKNKLDGSVDQTKKSVLESALPALNNSQPNTFELR